MRATTLALSAFCSLVVATTAMAGGSDGIQVLGTASIGSRVRIAPDAPTVTLVPAYSNITNQTFWAQGQFSAGLVGTDTITRMVADDITPVPAYAGLDVLQIDFTAGNFNNVPITARIRARFYAADGPGGLPGTYLWGFDGNGRVFAALTTYLFAKSIAAGQFPMPGAPFWAGISFDDLNGTSGATANQLGNMAQLTFSPATVGSTTDNAFESTNPGSFDAGFPGGSLFSSVGAPPTGPVAASFGWEFDIDGATPAKAATWGRVKGLYR